MSPSSFSPLLQCLAQLNDDVWTSVLLPKLVEQGTAGAVALTCSQLRRLCQHSVRILNLEKLPRSYASIATLAAGAAAVAEHFPHCTHLLLKADSMTDHMRLPLVLPVLGRLPKLNEVLLSVGYDADPAALLLGSLRTALTGLRALTVDPDGSWKTPYCWSQLAEFTHLTSLKVLWPSEAKDTCSCKDLSALGALGSLRQLALMPAAALKPDDIAELGQPGLYSWLGGLTALTSLELALATASGLPSISKCANMRSLVLELSDMRGTLRAEDWAALGQLTQLTQLNFLPATHGGLAGTELPECAAVIGQLTCLEEVGASAWPAAMLNVFSQLPHLRVINGGWQGSLRQLGSSTEPSEAATVCAHVTSLQDLHGPVPFQAFPNLRRLSQCSRFTLEAFAGLPQHCPNLQEVWVVGLKTAHGQEFTLDPWASLSERVSAIMSLSQLVHLSVLGFKPSTMHELAAFIVAAEALSNSKLQHVGVVVEQSSDVSVVNLMPLGRLTKIKKLQIMLCHEDVDLNGEEEADTLLIALCGVPSVDLAFVDEDMLAIMQRAEVDMKQLGLPLPDKLLLRKA